MIYTVTCNPAVDYVVRLENLDLGELNRSQADYKEAGGKGINVSRVLARLGEESTALGFIGGFTGTFITDYLSKVGIRHQFVSLEEDTRINVKLKADGEETEINGKSPEITNEEYQHLLRQLKELKEGDIVVLAGSLPKSLPSNTYQSIVSQLNDQGVTAILDTSGVPLKEAIQASPAFIKPNHHELAELMDEAVQNDQDVIRLAKKLRDTYHIDHILVSMAKDGAIYIGEAGVWKLQAPEGKAIHSVGAGDSAVAGFIYRWQQTKNAEEASKYAVAAGSATAFSKTLCTKEEVESLLSQVSVEKY
ncbi:1-phosphofructokinase [Gracilibacillus sp. YIM 98692]|uniref:1-phosphofructokinase n=1 Tax=Gracilibacillus sp. YIM 98692 TaxID=2663532 RepID=UPI0013D66E32|nr:1-phosphofructokinase [Gracilibacillus sp. YIM 98692]